MASATSPRPRAARAANGSSRPTPGGMLPGGTPAARAIALLSARALVAGIAALTPRVAPAQAAERTVALVGDLQSELGCPGDWQPECAATELTATGVTGQYAAEFTIPGGQWQYKAALYDTWDEAYGREGGLVLPLAPRDRE